MRRDGAVERRCCPDRSVQLSESEKGECDDEDLGCSWYAPPPSPLSSVFVSAFLLEYLAAVVIYCGHTLIDPNPLPLSPTLGQPKFRSMWERYCNGVDAIVYVPYP